ncbi:hypothetical protein [Streptomyces sp. TR02-1]|uniref:hypothetical protein n=1 Tax=Streptomyces sp. TR02-1 TaxID=3385977 RepID=UPI00399F556D
MYDVECDTSQADPLACARHLAEFLPARLFPTAFQRLRLAEETGRTRLNPSDPAAP